MFQIYLISIYTQMSRIILALAPHALNLLRPNRPLNLQRIPNLDSLDYDLIKIILQNARYLVMKIGLIAR